MLNPPEFIRCMPLPAACPAAPPALPGAEAVKTVDCDKATGKPHTLWVAFAKLYERHGDLPNARIIFEKATQVSSRQFRRRSIVALLRGRGARQAPDKARTKR
jgi:hypothetical protein